MPPWLVEGDPAIYGLLASTLAALLVVWWRNRKRNYLIAAGVVAALIFGYFILDRYIESDGEQMVRKVGEVADAVSANNLDAAFINVSETFDRGGVNKQQFRGFCRQVKDARNVDKVMVWDTTAGEISRATGTATVAFRFKVTGNWGESPPNYIGRVFFVLDSDGQWRVKSFDVYDSLNQSKTPLTIPGWGARR